MNMAGRLSKISDVDEPLMIDPARFASMRYTITKIPSRGHSSIGAADISPEKEGVSPSLTSETDVPQDDFEEVIFEISKDKNKFYEYNDMHQYLEDGPLNWQILQANEKKYDQIEVIFKRWADFLKELSKTGHANVKVIDGFANQLLADKESFVQNKEIYHLLSSFAKFLKEYNTYFEIFLKIVTESVQM